MQVDRSVKSRLCWSQFKTAIKRVYWQESRQAWNYKADFFHNQPYQGLMDEHIFCFSLMRILTLLMRVHSDGQHASCLFMYHSTMAPRLCTTAVLISMENLVCVPADTAQIHTLITPIRSISASI